MILKSGGFSNNEIEEMDMAVINYCIARITERKEIERLRNEIDIMNACRLSFASVEVKSGYSAYTKHYKEVVRRINSLYDKEDETPKVTIFDRVKKGKVKRIGI